MSQTSEAYTREELITVADHALPMRGPVREAFRMMLEIANHTVTEANNRQCV